MVEEKRASTSSELRHPAEGHVLFPMDRVGPGKGSEAAGYSPPAVVVWDEVSGPKVRWDEVAGPKKRLVEAAGPYVNEFGSGASAGVKACEVGLMETRRCSIVNEFGRILQTSQWSLAHRIEVCKVLECNGFNPSLIESHDWLLESHNWLTPLSRQEYAKQSLALVDKPHGINVNDISASHFPSLEQMSLDVEEELDKKLDKKLDKTLDKTLDKEITRDSIAARDMERSIWQKHLSKLRNNMMGCVFGDWKELRNLLEEELESLREKDKLEDWYKRAFEGKDIRWQPWEIYAAIEKGHVHTMRKMMADIGNEQWGQLKPREYRGATPLHWAALHNLLDRRLWYMISADLWPEELFDDFGFKPVHMAIFASSFRSGSHERTKDISRCLKMINGYAAILTGDPQLEPGKGEKLLDIVTWDLPRKKRTYGWNFVVSPLTRSTRDGDWIDSTGATDKRIDPTNISEIQSDYGKVNDEKFFVFKLVEEKSGKRKGMAEFIFVAKCYFNTPIHPLHLAIWIGHPLVVEKLIHSFKGTRYFSLKTDLGDTVLHLAFKAIDFERQFSKDEIKSWATPNFDDRVWSKEYMTKGMNYASREQVMTLVMRYLQSYPHMLNSQNNDGQTPLHIAIFHGNLSCVRALLRCDYANYNMKNKRGDTPREMVNRLKDKYSMSRCMYANILGRKCPLSKEVGFTAIICRDVWYVVEYRRIVVDLMGKLDSDLVRQQRILQISQWSFKQRIFALQMLEENPAGSDSMKDTYVKQCDLRLTEHRDDRLANDVVEQSVENANELQKLKFTFIKDTSSQYGDEQFEYEQRVFAAIEDGDHHEFERLLTRDILLTGISSYKGANPLHWAVLHGELGILSLISKNFAVRKLPFASEVTGFDTRTTIVDVPDGFGFTCLHLASIYSFIRLDPRSNPILCSDKRILSRDIERDESLPMNLVRENHTQYEMIVDELRGMGLWRGLNQGLWRDVCGDFVVWSTTSTNTYLTQTLFSPLHFAVAHPHGFEILIKETPSEAWLESNVKTGDTILHNAERWEEIVGNWTKDEWRKIEFTLLKQLHDLKAVNSRNWNRETPLHRAVRTKSSKWVEVLLQVEHIRFNLRDKKMLTPGDLANEMLRDKPTDTKVQKIVHLLYSYDTESWPQKKAMDQRRIEEDRRRIEEDRKMIEGLQRERQVYVDAGNAILVGGALIASASFGAWLQPPLGLHPYYSSEFLDTSAPPAVGPIYDSYVAIQQHWTIQMFWIFNSLSFFFSLAAVIAGADAALPSPGLDVEQALNSVKRAVKLEAWLLIASIVSVIGTFATVGFTVLPPIFKYRKNMIGTVVVGVVLCVCILVKLLKKLCSLDTSSDRASPANQATSNQDSAPAQSSTDQAFPPANDATSQQDPAPPRSSTDSVASGAS